MVAGPCHPVFKWKAGKPAHVYQWKTCKTAATLPAEEDYPVLEIDAGITKRIGHLSWNAETMGLRSGAFPLHRRRTRSVELINGRVPPFTGRTTTQIHALVLVLPVTYFIRRCLRPPNGHQDDLWGIYTYTLPAPVLTVQIVLASL